MISAWTKHLKDSEKDHFQRSILSSKPVLDRLKDLMKEIEADQSRIERDIRIYESPNWDYKMAHLNGFKDCLNKINKIITLDQEDKQ